MKKENYEKEKFMYWYDPVVNSTYNASVSGGAVGETKQEVEGRML
jgi:hypothetical protein